MNSTIGTTGIQIRLRLNAELPRNKNDAIGSYPRKRMKLVPLERKNTMLAIGTGKNALRLIAI
jgi:hypothetical protein